MVGALGCELVVDLAVTKAGLMATTKAELPRPDGWLVG
jgi:hypothetical protein